DFSRHGFAPPEERARGLFATADPAASSPSGPPLRREPRHGSPHFRRLLGAHGVLDRRLLRSPATPTRRAMLRLWRTALACPSTFASRAGWSSRLSPSSMSARSTI